MPPIACMRAERENFHFVSQSSSRRRELSAVSVIGLESGAGRRGGGWEEREHKEPNHSPPGVAGWLRGGGGEGHNTQQPPSLQFPPFPTGKRTGYSPSLLNRMGQKRGMRKMYNIRTEEGAVVHFISLYIKNRENGLPSPGPYQMNSPSRPPPVSLSLSGKEFKKAGGVLLMLAPPLSI